MPADVLNIILERGQTHLLHQVIFKENLATIRPLQRILWMSCLFFELPVG
ncbi:hypothetical protein [Helicobacter cynogastricus]|nr:hypothetical protein [Helicobacter cynogastricus]